MGLHIARYTCPVCQGEPHASACLYCHRSGLTDDVEGWDPEDYTEAPRPPAVMRSPCGDCAFRTGSPEQETDYELNALRSRERVFYCHHGMPLIDGSYQPVAELDGVPVGYMVCAGWWASVTGAAPPATPYRESPAERRQASTPTPPQEQ
ncbi:hypothetical protein DY218_27165 [Streptomyces triticagri]|uniref:Uncharacterized protein n=1 Tax=Streptomyces triticagri TaxID=2293568 RepID=A0A372LY87_9ACTN|nr:hypothetical protein [Streptomyces triticagri]RFU83591.1 hypothetical protein DY218_27165 [Streptomyces triticagri]